MNLLGEVDSLNEKTLDILQKTDDEILNHPYFYLFEENPRIIELITKCIETSDSVIEPNIILQIKDVHKNINFTARPLIDANNEAIGVIIGLENITEELIMRYVEGDLESEESQKFERILKIFLILTCLLPVIVTYLLSYFLSITFMQAIAASSTFIYLLAASFLPL